MTQSKTMRPAWATICLIAVTLALAPAAVLGLSFGAISAPVQGLQAPGTSQQGFVSVAAAETTDLTTNNEVQAIMGVQVITSTTKPTTSKKVQAIMDVQVIVDADCRDMSVALAQGAIVEHLAGSAVSTSAIFAECGDDQTPYTIFHVIVTNDAEAAHAKEVFRGATILVEGVTYPLRLPGDPYEEEKNRYHFDDDDVYDYGNKTMHKGGQDPLGNPNFKTTTRSMASGMSQEAKDFLSATGAVLGVAALAVAALALRRKRTGSKSADQRYGTFRSVFTPPLPPRDYDGPESEVDDDSETGDDATLMPASQKTIIGWPLDRPAPPGPGTVKHYISSPGANSALVEVSLDAPGGRSSPKAKQPVPTQRFQAVVPLKADSSGETVEVPSGYSMFDELA